MGKCFAAIAALCLIGTAYAASGDYERALELLRARKLGEAVTALTRADRDSDPRATNALAELYQAGFGVPRDETRACELFEKAAKRGVVSAQYNFGQCFFLGKGGRTQDYAQSKQWYERAIEAGGPPAFCALGAQYKAGLGVPKDVGRAAALCAQGAALGDPNAQADLGEMYLAGVGVPRDLAAAQQWLAQAAAQKHGRAMLNLGLMYWNGDGVAKDPMRARELIVGACNIGISAAYFHAGRIFLAASVDREKQKVDDDYAWIALFWLQLAAERDPIPPNRAEAQTLYAGLANMASPAALTKANDAIRVRKAQETALGIRP
jgi:hypothetical protein